MSNVNCIINDVKLKDDEFNNELPFNWAKLTFAENPEVIKDFENLKNTIDSLKNKGVLIGFCLGYNTDDF